MYECEDILKEKFNLIKDFLESQGSKCEIDLVRNYMIQIEVNSNTKFKLHYSPKKNTFKPEFVKSFDKSIEEEIRRFIDGDGLVKSIVDKEDKNKAKEDRKEAIKVRNKLIKEKDKRKLKKIYSKLEQYKDCNIEFEPLIDALMKVCTEEEKKQIQENRYNFDKLEEITRGHIIDIKC